MRHMIDKIKAFRGTAMEADVSSDIVDLLAATARPCVTLGPDIDGPVVGVFGGPPPAASPLPFVASIDCALIPEGATDLPLPESGTLLLFGRWAGECAVRYAAAGTVLTASADPQVYPRRELRMSLDASVDQEVVEFDEENDPEGELFEVLDEVYGVLAPRGLLRIGGHPPFHNYLPAGPDRYVLATWTDTAGDLDVDHGIIHWTIPREDLVAGRFDRVESCWDMA